MTETCIMIWLIIFLTEERCTHLCNILRWNFFRSPHLHVPGGLSVPRDYNPQWSVVTGVCAVWNVYWLVDLLACLIQYIWNAKIILISMVYDYYINLIQYSLFFKNKFHRTSSFLSWIFSTTKRENFAQGIASSKSERYWRIIYNINSLRHLKTKITKCFQHTSYVFSRKQIFIQTISRFS